jgi:hypothetical protein
MKVRLRTRNIFIIGHVWFVTAHTEADSLAFRYYFVARLALDSSSIAGCSSEI